MIEPIYWLWSNSAALHKGRGLRLILRRARFMLRALSVYSSLKPFLEAPRDSPLGRLLARRPQTVGAVIWPYQCLSWDARTRLGRIREHYSAVERIGGPIDFPVEDRLILLDLGSIRDGLRVILDQPRWFMREGQLTINLFLDETRLYSLSFSLSETKAGLTTFVGSIQGRDIENVLDEYRAITKDAHGMRPRDLLIEVFRMFCVTLGVTQIFAVADEYRHHRDRYFGTKSKDKLSANYNEIWEDRGGVRVDAQTYRLDVERPERDLSEIATKKRAMYRRRYEMLKVLGQQMADNYHQLTRETAGAE